jgi:hypothetical protein
MTLYPHLLEKLKEDFRRHQAKCGVCQENGPFCEIGRRWFPNGKNLLGSIDEVVVPAQQKIPTPITTPEVTANACNPAVWTPCNCKWRNSAGCVIRHRDDCDKFFPGGLPRANS